MRYIHILKIIGTHKILIKDSVHKTNFHADPLYIFKCNIWQPATGHMAALQQERIFHSLNFLGIDDNFRRVTLRGKSILWGLKSKLRGGLETH